MTRTTKALLIALVLMVLAAGYLNRPQSTENQRKVEVYNACYKAWQEVNMFSENYCGALQDEYNINFICEQSYRSNPDATCWAVER